PVSLLIGTYSSRVMRYLACNWASVSATVPVLPRKTSSRLARSLQVAVTYNVVTLENRPSLVPG
ncbi:MAG TPA: hypothetical protein VMY18_12330, partial [Acidobacteriota bacterium]|nr:hypothetical protein [Acidobacteriota bacterium]